MVKDNFLFRGIDVLSTSRLRTLIKKGNDRVDGKVEGGLDFEYLKKKYELEVDQWLWATHSFDMAWGNAEYNFPYGGNGTRFIAIYNGDLLEGIRENENIYVLKKGVGSFKDAFIGLIAIKFL